MGKFRTCVEKTKTNTNIAKPVLTERGETVRDRCFLSPIPGLQSLHTFDLLLQLQDTVQEGLRSGGTARDIDVHRDDPITAAHYAVRVVIVATSIGAGAHGDHPARFQHLGIVIFIY